MRVINQLKLSKPSVVCIIIVKTIKATPLEGGMSKLFD